MKIHEHVEEVLDFWNKMLERADRIDFTRLLEEKLGCPLDASYEEWIHINHYEEIDERVAKWLYRQEKRLHCKPWRCYPERNCG